jgi:DNA-binding response OmpR family regulator
MQAMPVSRLRVLVVDDEEQVRSMLVEALEDRGYEVESAIHGGEAIRLLHAAPFDLVISDIVMPDKDGLELLVHIRRNFPTLQVIIISAPDNELYMRTARGLGATRVLCKPFTIDEMSSAVAELLPG